MSPASLSPGPTITIASVSPAPPTGVPAQRCTCAAGHGGSGRYVFLGPDGGHHRNSNYARRIFRPACDGRHPPANGSPGKLVIADTTAWPGTPAAAWPPAAPGKPFAPPSGRGTQRLTSTADTGRCRAAARPVPASVADGERPAGSERGTPGPAWRPAGQAAGHSPIPASGQRDDEVLEASADNDAAVAAYRLSVQAGNPLSERRLAQMFGRTSRRWARARIADARQASPLPDSPSTPVAAYP